MQTNNFDISDSGRIIIEDRIFYSTNTDVSGLIENANTKEKGILKEYSSQADIEKLDSFGVEVVSAIGNVRGIKNVIYPQVFACKNEENILDKFYAFTEIPMGMMNDKVHQLSKVVSASGFLIYSRVMAALNLSETLYAVKDFLGQNIISIHPEDIFVNTETGEIFVWIEQWLNEVKEATFEMDFGLSPEWYTREDKKCDERDFQYFLSYVIFRLLCNDEPFDGRETLIQFPCLTAEAKRRIYSGQYSFSLAKGNNAVSEYIGQSLLKKWKALPSFIRNMFEHNFTSGVADREVRTEIEHWLKNMRKLRDCLVYVNGQFRFCDPDMPNRVLFMLVEDYKIPVWPKKALYWYHVGMPFSESQNGVIAGISAKEGGYFLNNLSGDVLGATLNNTNVWVHPGKDIELMEGLTIRLENDTVIKVINGQKVDQGKIVDVTVADMKSAWDNTLTENQLMEDDISPVELSEDVGEGNK